MIKNRLNNLPTKKELLKKGTSYGNTYPKREPIFMFKNEFYKLVDDKVIHLKKPHK